MACAKKIFVVSCPRSGSSALAQLLVSMGLRTVADERRNADYSAGYSEFLPLLMFHKALERLPRGADHRLTVEPFIRADYLDDEFIAAMFGRAFAPFDRNDVDFLKFPQLALSARFLLERFPDCAVLALWREPAATFRSLVRRELPREMFPSSLLKSVVLWNIYAHHIIEAKHVAPDRVAVVHLEGMLAADIAPHALLRCWGYDELRDVRPLEVIRGDALMRPVSAAWQFLRVAASLLARIVTSGRVPAEFADVSVWRRRLQKVTEGSETHV